MSENENPDNDLLPKGGPKNNYQIWIIALLVMFVVGLTFFNKSNSSKITSRAKFEDMLSKGEVKDVILVTNERLVEFSLNEKGLAAHKEVQVKQGPFPMLQEAQFKFKIASVDEFEKYMRGVANGDKTVNFMVDARHDLSSWFFNLAFLALIVFGFWYLMRRMAGGGGGGQIFNIGKSKAALFDAESKIKITFNDVAGLNEAKEEIEEIVQFLKHPKKYTDLGGKIPKGALLIGPPGTGKTLLAKAVAGESGVPFFSLSGSDFVEMFVGVGASRVRDLFKQAKEKAPCIIFIDEIDAIGRARGRGQMPGSNDERENTLNALLVEMDGFATDAGVIILAATNRPDILDNALLRPGRFDRQISIDKPDINGREAIFSVHLKPLKLGDDLNSKDLAAQTPGFAGAEIANVCNEAALIAARKNKKSIEMQDFQDAIDRVIGGLEKKNKIISPEEKTIVAYHEAGHAVAGWFSEHADPLVKVSIVPRGVAALGYAQYLPKEQFLHTTEQMMDEMCMALGGRAAEELTFGKISTGALSDLERITKMAYSMVSIYGMNAKLGNISFYDSKRSEYYSDKPYSEATAQIIDQEVKELVALCYKKTIGLLTEHKDALEILAKTLLQKEVLFQKDIVGLIGPRPFNHKTTYEAYQQGDFDPAKSKAKENEPVVSLKKTEEE